MAFRLDIYTLSDVFLNHAARTNRVSASSFCDVGDWVLTLSSSSLSSFSDSLVWCGVLFLVNSSFSKLKATVFTGLVDGSVVGSVSSFSGPSELYKVSLSIEPLSGARCGISFNFRCNALAGVKARRWRVNDFES